MPSKLVLFSQTITKIVLDSHFELCFTEYRLIEISLRLRVSSKSFLLYYIVLWWSPFCAPENTVRLDPRCTISSELLWLCSRHDPCVAPKQQGPVKLSGPRHLYKHSHPPEEFRDERWTAQNKIFRTSDWLKVSQQNIFILYSIKYSKRSINEA